MTNTIYTEPNLATMARMEDNSIDAIVTDPPYGLKFMGKKWDHDVPGVDIWKECLRVLKPGGHLLAFAGTRTQHRMACAIEDAGFEIRDLIMWCYGSGFPKSVDISKMIDKCNGETDRLLRFTRWFRKTGMTRKNATDAMVRDRHILENGTMAGHYFADSMSGQPAIPTRAIWATLRPLCGDVPAWVDELVERIEAEREVIGQKNGTHPTNHFNASNFSEGAAGRSVLDITAPATDLARQWAGWGSALKPALEPVTMARKPFKGTLAGNVTTWGTGGINVDGCRIGVDDGYMENAVTQGVNTSQTSYEPRRERRTFEPSQFGRFPANLIHDGSDEVVGLFPEPHGAGFARESAERKGDPSGCFGMGTGPGQGGRHGDSGSAARFFYCAKSSRAERDAGLDDQRNGHPCVKPIDLMRYLCRLVTPPGGLVYDPFCGSGTTLIGAKLEGFRWVGSEMDPEYAEIARKRVAAVTFMEQMDLFNPSAVRQAGLFEEVDRDARNNQTTV